MNLASTSSETTLNGKCRLCGLLKKCRVINDVYNHGGQQEVYADIIKECFGVTLTVAMDGEPRDRLICATCVMRLRESRSFRNQILRCEQMLQSTLHTGEYGTNTLRHIPKIPEYDNSLYPRTERVKPELQTEEDKRKEYIQILKEAEKAKNRLLMLTKSDLKVAAKKRKKVVTVPTVMYGPEAELRKKLLAHMDKLKALEGDVDDPDPLLYRPKRLKDNMAYENTVNLVQYSYICPFNNIIGTYHCFYCKKTYVEPHELRTHTLSHDPKTFQRMWPSKKKVKIDIFRIDCRLCSDKIDTIDDLKRHLSNNHNKLIHDSVNNEFLSFRLDDKMVCLVCNISFLFIDKLIDHMTVHFGAHVCDVCGISFVQLSSLESHIRCHKKSETVYPCSVCNKILKSNRSRYLHISVVHEKKAIIKCFKCEKTFLSYERRDKHLIDDHGDSRSYPCKLCGKVFNRRKQYVTHNRVAHDKQYKFQCHICSRLFHTNKHMKKHIETQHQVNNDFYPQYLGNMTKE